MAPSILKKSKAIRTNYGGQKVQKPFEPSYIMVQELRGFIGSFCGVLHLPDPGYPSPPPTYLGSFTGNYGVIITPSIYQWYYSIHLFLIPVALFYPPLPYTTDTTASTSSLCERYFGHSLLILVATWSLFPYISGNIFIPSLYQW